MDRELAGLSPPIYPPYKAHSGRPFVPKSVLYDRLVRNFLASLAVIITMQMEDGHAHTHARSSFAILNLCDPVCVCIQTLRFEGFYVEDSVAWGYSRRTVHPVKLSYYLEDDTISVHEPVTPVRLIKKESKRGELIY